MASRQATCTEQRRMPRATPQSFTASPSTTTPSPHKKKPKKKPADRGTMRALKRASAHSALHVPSTIGNPRSRLHPSEAPCTGSRALSTHSYFNHAPRPRPHVARAFARRAAQLCAPSNRLPGTRRAMIASTTGQAAADTVGGGAQDRSRCTGNRTAGALAHAALAVRARERNVLARAEANSVRRHEDAWAWRSGITWWQSGLVTRQQPRRSLD